MALLLAALLAAPGCAPRTPVEAAPPPPPADLAARGDVVETLHGVEVADPYRWMEEADSQPVADWTAARNADFAAHTDALPQRAWLYERLQQLWRYDDVSTPSPCLLSDRYFLRTKAADQDKWVVHLHEGTDGVAGDADAGRVVLDPNTWDDIETLAGFAPSPDCRYVAYGVARGGDENPALRVMDLDTLELLDDTLRGWRQGGVSWRHDNAGFYYTSKPLEGEVTGDGHFYFHRAWYHALGTPAEDDVLVFHDPEVKEHWHGVSVSEGGRWAVQSRSLFNKGALWLRDLQSDAEPAPIVTDMDAKYSAQVVEADRGPDRILIRTDWEAPNYRLMVTSVDAPGREHWEELIPASDDVLTYVGAIGGRLYAVYQRDAATRILIYGLDGEALGELELPTVGSAWIRGFWSEPTVWLSFNSFATPAATWTYDAASDTLDLYKASAVPVDPDLIAQIEVEQVWYPSADGIEVSMFVVRRRGAQGPIPWLLTGYGGFNISMKPRFSTRNLVWLEAGGGVAIPNLRGGGEYGVAWHEAGMREQKQNVFDDFIAAATWLIDQGWTTPDQLAIAGGSNGGLLVSAAVTQRPDIFGAVLCAVPLTDMVRFHRFGIANIWTEEYGSAEDPEMFPHILAYSPYHRVTRGANYPAILVTGSENDARTDPVHARKFAAAARWADADRGAAQPILLHIQGDSGHGGGVTIDTRADQTARHTAFLMHAIEMQAPSVE